MRDKYIETTLNSRVGLEPGTRSFKRGSLLILIAPPFENYGWHMSISCKSRMPQWFEIRDAWYALIPESETREGHLVLPRKSEYVDLHPFCMHVHETIVGK